MKVMMQDGVYKRIDKVSVGETVMTYDFEMGVLKPTYTKKIDSPFHHEMVFLQFSKKIEIITY